MTAAIEALIEALTALEDNTPDFLAPERAAHDAAVDAARRELHAAFARQAHAAHVAKTYSAALGGKMEARVHTFGTQVRIAGRWHMVGTNVDFTDCYNARCSVTGKSTWARMVDGRWLVTAYRADGSNMQTMRCSHIQSAMKQMSSLLG